MQRIGLFRGILLGVIAFALVWWTWDAPIKRGAEEARPESLDPDFYMTDVDSLQYSESGEPRYQMTASQMSHYPHNDITEITVPHMIVYQEDGSPWRLSSLYGQILPGGDIVELWDEVEVRYEPVGQNPTQMTTESLRIFPKREYAETYQAVTIESPQGTTTARGMQADLKTNRLKLLAKVNGEYESRKRR